MTPRLMTVISFIPRVVIVGLMFTLLVDMMLGVFFRYVVGRALPWTEEVGTLSLVWLAFIGGAVGINRGTHFAIAVVTERLTPGQARVAGVTVALLVVLLGVLLVVCGWMLMWANTSSETPGLGLNLAVLYAPSFVGGLLTICYASALARRTIRGVVSPLTS